MVPDTNDDRTPPGDGAPDKTDGGSIPGFDEAALYAVVRNAVEDALLGVVGTLLLVGVAFVVVWVGAAAIVSTQSPLGIVLGSLAILFGVYLAAATLGVIPPIREWF